MAAGAHVTLTGRRTEVLAAAWNSDQIEVALGTLDARPIVFTIEGALDVPRQLSESEFENVRLEVQRLLRKGLDESELTINDAH